MLHTSCRLKRLPRRQFGRNAQATGSGHGAVDPQTALGRSGSAGTASAQTRQVEVSVSGPFRTFGARRLINHAHFLNGNGRNVTARGAIGRFCAVRFRYGPAKLVQPAFAIPFPAYGRGITFADIVFSVALIEECAGVRISAGSLVPVVMWARGQRRTRNRKDHVHGRSSVLYASA